jgi:hypothetical protein
MSKPEAKVPSAEEIAAELEDYLAAHQKNERPEDD